MSGVRLVSADPDAAGTTLVVSVPVAYGVPFLCPRCKSTHEFKTYHLDIDGEGAVIVSPGVLDTLRRFKMLERTKLAVSNEVRRPPTIRIRQDGVPGVVNGRILTHRITGGT